MDTQIDANEWLMSGGAKSISWKDVPFGTTATGLIARRPEVMQQRDMDGNPKVWKDGNPMMMLRVILNTEERDPENEDDDGQRALYIRGQMQQAVRQAVQQAGAPGLEVGGKLQVKYVSDGKASQRGFNPPKQFEARYRSPAPEPVPVPVEPVAAQTKTFGSDDEVPF